MKEILDQITEAWQSLSGKQRLSLIISAALTVAVVGGVVYLARQPSFTVLRVGVDHEEAQAIVDELQAAKVPFKLEEGGSTILVPFENVDAMRLQLGSKGLLQTGSGSISYKDIFNSNGIGQSNRMQRAQMQKALEADVARSIESLDEVRHARVHIVAPGERVFLDDDAVAKASVTLALRAGARPSHETIRAIANTVAGAVPELSPNWVSVIDTEGNVHWDGNGEGSHGVVAQRQAEFRRAFEQNVNRQIATVLEPELGTAGFVVETTAVLDMTRRVRREKNYDPNGGVITHEQKSKKKSASGRAGGGAPGTAANLPGAAGQRAAQTTSRDEESQQQSSFEYSFAEEESEAPVGVIERLSVAVNVDQRWETPEGASEAQPIARTPEEMQRYEDLIKAAISFDETRGDNVVVRQGPFARQIVEESAGGFDPKSWLPFVKWPGLALLLLIGFFLFLRPTLATVRQAVGGGSRAASAASIEAQRQLGAPSQVELMRQRLNSLASEQPEGMAQTMRVWLHEEAE